MQLLHLEFFSSLDIANLLFAQIFFSVLFTRLAAGKLNVRVYLFFAILRFSSFYAHE